jgi:membrane protein
MADQDPRDQSPAPRKTFAQKLLTGWTVLWSWLTDPAVLIYRRAAHGRKRARVVIVEFFLLVREVTREFWMLEGTSRAASLAYTTLLSLIPLLVGFIGPIQRYLTEKPDYQSTIDNILNSVIPYRSPLISDHIARFVENAGAASIVGVIVFLIISFRLFLAVEGSVNHIWKVRSTRGYRSKIIAFTMLFFWGPLLMTLSFTTTKSLENSRYLRAVFRSEFVFQLFPIVVLFIAFTMLFWLVPSTRVKFSSAVVGAVITALFFSLVRWGFGIYADHLIKGNFNYIYGALGLAIIFLVAIEVMWIIILLGVEISYVYQNLYGVLRATEQQIDDEPRFDLYFALRALIEVTRRFERREDAPSSYRLAEQFGTTDAQMLRVLRKLEDAKLVKETGGDWTGFVPGCDPDRISVEEVVSQIEGSVRVLPQLGPDDEERRAVGSLFATLNSCTANALDRMTVGRLVRELYAPRAVRNDDRVSGT